MTYISGYRGEGKTVELIRGCAENDGLIICANESNKYYILEKAGEFGLKIREPLTINEVIAGKARGIKIDKLYIDELENALIALLHNDIYPKAEITASINRENVYTLENDIKKLNYYDISWTVPSTFIPSGYGYNRNVSDELDFSVLIGKVLVSIEGLTKDSEQVIFTCADGKRYIMYHEQDCCESVTVADVCGNLNSIIGSPITLADCATQQGNDEDSWGTSTWTFYKLATLHGYVDIRWLGESNGYYSETVSFCAILPPKGENNK